MMKCSRILTLLLMLAILALPSLAFAADGSVAEGERLMGEGNAKKALKTFEKAGGAEGMVGVAWAQNVLGKHDKAAEAARKALGLSPEPAVAARANYQLGVALVGNGKDAAKLGEAEQAFRTALNPADPANAANEARVGLAKVLVRTGKAAEAVAVSREFLAAEPTGENANQARVALCEAKLLTPGTPVTAPATAAAPASGAVKAALTNSQPKEIERPQPDWSDKVLRKAANTKVVIKAMIDEDGCTKDIKVENAVPEVATIISAAVQKWVFQPGFQNGRPVAWPIATEMLIAEPRDKGYPRDLHTPIHQAPTQ
jgi:tetratricopeptide (TPR) repeat protein